MNHRERHRTYVEGCFACKVLTINPNISEVTRVNDSRDKTLAADLAAYQRLRRNGLQPKGIDGSAKLEYSDMQGQYDIDLGHLIPKDEQSRVHEAMAISREMGLITEGGR